MLKIFIDIFTSPIILIPTLIIALFTIIKHRHYRKSAYYRVTKNPYSAVRRDAGKYGEYLTYKYLRKFEKRGARFLFNLYIPKKNGETSEIDMLMINQKGIFVFESKNYSGWIFGNESRRTWYQTLPNGNGRSQSEKFYNPIMQNHSHIIYLSSVIGRDIPTYSIIVFSERCTLKRIQLNSNNVKVVTRDRIKSAMLNTCKYYYDVLDEERIDELYDELYPYTQVDKHVKSRHNRYVRNVNR